MPLPYGLVRMDFVRFRVRCATPQARYFPIIRVGPEAFYVKV